MMGPTFLPLTLLITVVGDEVKGDGGGVEDEVSGVCPGA